MKPVLIRVRRLGATPVPQRQTAGAAGFDLHAAEAVVVKPGSFAVVPTGIAIEMPESIEGQVRPRSGLAARSGIGVLNGPGTIDSDYRGEIKVILFNMSGRRFQVRPGDRVAQLVFARALDVRLVETRHLSSTGRGAGGFGHTGRK